MITLLTGENSFMLERALDALIRDATGEVERRDGEALTVAELPSLLMGLSLFSSERLVIIRGASMQKDVWEALPTWLGRMADEVHVVLVEPKPDKRTKTYKAIAGMAKVQAFAPWTDKDRRVAEAWVQDEATLQGVALGGPEARLLVERAGVGAWALYHAVEKLAALDTVTKQAIEEYIDASPSENVFQLFETALRGDKAGLGRMLHTLRRTEDPYQVFGLLASQVVQLAALAAADDGQDVAKDIGAHPFVLSKLRPHAKKLGLAGARDYVQRLAAADARMKTSSVDPWVVIERALVG